MNSHAQTIPDTSPARFSLLRCPARCVQHILAATALLLPLASFAQTPLHISDSADAWTGTTYSFTQDTTNYDILTIRDQHVMTGPGTSASLDFIASFGSITASVSGSSDQPGKPAPETTGGSAYATGEMAAYSRVTISSAAITNGYGNVYAVVSTSGDAQAAMSSFSYNSGSAGYSFSTAFAGIGARYGGNITDTGWEPTGGNDAPTFLPISAIGTVVITNIFYPDYPHLFQMLFTCSAGGFVIPEPCTFDRSGSGSLHFEARLVRVVVMDDQYQPINFTMQSEMGSGRGDVLQPGASYSGITLSNSAPGHIGSTVTLLDGVADAVQQVLMTFQAPPHDVGVASDVVDVNGTGTNKVVIQMSYDPAKALNLIGDESAMRLVWRNPATKKLVNAVAGNIGGAASLVKRAFDPLLDTQLGKFGVDISCVRHRSCV